MFGITRLRLKQPKTSKPVYEFEVTNWFGRWMWNKSWGGLTTPLPFLTVICYWLLPGDHVDPLVRVHEFVHVAQRDRLGLVRDWVSYERGAVADGYDKNPLELEAYAVEAAAEKDGLPDWAKP